MVSNGVLPEPRRAVVYALSADSRTLESSTVAAIEAVASHATRLVVTVPTNASDAAARLAHLDAQVIDVHTARFSPSNYREALEALKPLHGEIDEIVLTGDGWFGPLNSFDAMLERMDAVPGDGWQAAEIAGELDESFPDQGHALQAMPWTWFVARRSLFESRAWNAFWDEQARRPREAEHERLIARVLTRAGRRIEFAFASASYPTGNAPTHVPDLLIEDGYPFLDRGVFGWYPAYLDKHGIIGSDVLDAAEGRGLDRDATLSALARTVQPRTLNANAGLLEILPRRTVVPGADASGLRVVAVVYARDLPEFENLCGQLANLPAGFDLVVTTTDGRKAARVERFIEAQELGHSRLDVRVTPSKKGRDMADFFVGCHDLLLERDYDVIVKVHARKHTKKTLNVVRYFTRYQTENLLSSPEYVQNVLGMFAAKPHLGVVFPPTMHIGYSILGSGWGGGRYRIAATRFLRKLGVHVPLENVSPLAPYGGMWICRPEALAPLAERRLGYRDYTSSGPIKDFARIQERVIAHVAGEAGYYAQTVLTPEHAAISHTAIDYKVDQLFSTTRGYPVDAIRLVQRAGRMSGSGIFGLSRMHLTMNHPVLAAIASPVYKAAYLAIHVAKLGRKAIRYARRRISNYRGGF
ncbi:rhamnan synthesis F family protein [Microbacterium sp. NPDC087665]|uniref:rhamnan synthesis F family protein n=1 Tax=Microbacterium sp. NPDC087665 TaxID=3364194 RepID=UPI00381CDB13